jgi:ASC-1-like (ASCH) protein
MARTWVLRIRAADHRVFDALRAGTKTVETRLATPRYRAACPGDRLLFLCGAERLERQVKAVRIVPSIEALAQEFAPSSILPGAKNAEDLRALYATFPGYEEKIVSRGIVAFML